MYNLLGQIEQIFISSFFSGYLVFLVRIPDIAPSNFIEKPSNINI